MAVTDEAIGKIKQMITEGRLRPGDRLPPEKELGESLGLSRNSLREAIKALEVIRVLDVRRGDGTYVTSLEPHLLLEVVSFVADLQHDASVLDVFAVRRVLEPAAAAMAVPHTSDDDIVHLRSLLADVDGTASVDELVAHDVVFHRYVNQLCGNGYLASLLDNLSTQTLRARAWRALTEENAVEQTLSEHRAIVDALEARDAALVASQVTVHVAGVARWLQNALRVPTADR